MDKFYIIGGGNAMNKKVSKSMLWASGTLIVLGVSYWFCRFLMFDVHGMKQWPTLLCIVTLVVLVLSLVLKKRWLSATTDLGYIGGFFIALFFNSDGVDAGGGGTNNLWIIWIVILFTCVIVGIVIEIAINRKGLNQ